MYDSINNTLNFLCKFKTIYNKDMITSVEKLNLPNSTNESNLCMRV